MSRPLRWLIVGLALLAAALAASELLLPGYLEGRIEDGLSDNGGWAHVTLEGEPAVRLLAGHGDRVVVEGGELRLDLPSPGSQRGTDLFDKLEGFDAARIRLEDFSAGPVKARRLLLERPRSDAPYHFRANASVSPAALVRYAASQVWAPAAALGGLLAGDVGEEPVPLDFDARLSSEDGRVRVISAQGEVAGIATGALGEALLGAVLSQL